MSTATGEIGDLNFIYSIKEVGSSEAARYDGGPNSTKEPLESKVKLPLLLGDQLRGLQDFSPGVAEDIITAGYIISSK